MQISSQKSYSQNFEALLIASSGNKTLYRICDSTDKKYLKQLVSKVNPGDLMPNLSKDGADRWHEMLRYAVDMAQNPDNVTYLETVNNKPCGIITYSSGKNSASLDCVCTWPVEVGKKIKLAGKILFYQVFRDFQILNLKKIKLEAITNGPYDTVKKYEELGFKKTSDVFPTKIVMEINSNRLKETFKRLSSIFDYTPERQEKVNLALTLD